VEPNEHWDEYLEVSTAILSLKGIGVLCAKHRHHSTNVRRIAIQSNGFSGKSNDVNTWIKDFMGQVRAK